jgi:hypothetical protein
MVLFSICTNYLVEQIPPEIQLQDHLRYAGNQDQNQAMNQAMNSGGPSSRRSRMRRTPWQPFIRIERRPDSQFQDFTVTESSVQYMLKIALYGLLIAFLFLEVGLLGYLFPFWNAETCSAETVFGWLFVFVVGLIWFVDVWHGIDQIRAIITDRLEPFRGWLTPATLPSQAP